MEEERIKIFSLAVIVFLSFLIHASPSLFVEQYPLYNLDSWLTIKQVSLANSGNDVSYINQLNPPNGKYLNEQNTIASWRPLNALFHSLFTDSTEATGIFNDVGFLHPILFSMFLIAMYIICRDLFGSDISLGIVALTAFTPSMLFNDIIYGSFDHHLLEVIFGTVFLLSIIGIGVPDKKPVYLLLGVSSLILGWFNTPVFIVFLGTGALMVLVLLAYKVTQKQSDVYSVLLPAVLFILSFIIGVPAAIKTSTGLFTAISGHISPNRELSVSIPSLVILPLFTILVLITVYELYKNREIRTMLVTTAIVPLFIASCILIRAEMLIDPMLAVFVAIVAYNYFKKYYWAAIVGISVMCIIGSGIAIYNVVGTAHANNGLSEGLQYIAPMDDGVVLSWMGDAGFWILAVANKSPLEDPSGNYAAETKITEMFHENNATELKRMLGENNVAYIIVSSRDCDTSVGAAYKDWCNRESTVGEILFDKKDILIYKV